MSLYLDGEWEAAHASLEECQQMYPDDGPTNYLLKFMHEHGGEAPMDWKGYRDARGCLSGVCVCMHAAACSYAGNGKGIEMQEDV